MLDLFIKEYKKACEIRSLTWMEWTHLSIMLVMVGAILVFKILDLMIGIVITIAIMILDMIWLVLSTRLRQNEIGDSLAGFNKRIKQVKNALNKYNLYDRKSIEWMIEVSKMRLQKEPRGEYIKPFATAVTVPILLGLVTIIEKQVPIEFIMNFLVIFIDVMFIFYFELIMVESDIRDMVNSKYRLLEKMNEDLSYIILKDFRDENKQIRVGVGYKLGTSASKRDAGSRKWKQNNKVLKRKV